MEQEQQRPVADAGEARTEAAVEALLLGLAANQVIEAQGEAFAKTEPRGAARLIRVAAKIAAVVQRDTQLALKRYEKAIGLLPDGEDRKRYEQERAALMGPEAPSIFARRSRALMRATSVRGLKGLVR